MQRYGAGMVARHATRTEGHDKTTTITEWLRTAEPQPLSSQLAHSSLANCSLRIRREMPRCRRCIHASGSAMVVWCGPATEAHGRTTPATKRCRTVELSRATGRAACSALAICSSLGSCGCGAVQADMTPERLGGLPPRPRHTASPLWLLNSVEQAVVQCPDAV